MGELKILISNFVWSDGPAEKFSVREWAPH